MLQCFFMNIRKDACFFFSCGMRGEEPLGLLSPSLSEASVDSVSHTFSVTAHSKHNRGNVTLRLAYQYRTYVPVVVCSHQPANFSRNGGEEDGQTSQGVNLDA